MMPIAPEALLEQALSLSPADRAKLASGLLASLDDDQADEAEVERLWSEETDRRMALLDSGDVDLIEWEHVTERIDGLRASSTAE
jgi:putative addiction module component (TIGR02574 family)